MWEFIAFVVGIFLGGYTVWRIWAAAVEESIREVAAEVVAERNEAIAERNAACNERHVLQCRLNHVYDCLRGIVNEGPPPVSDVPDGA